MEFLCHLAIVSSEYCDPVVLRSGISTSPDDTTSSRCCLKYAKNKQQMWSMVIMVPDPTCSSGASNSILNSSFACRSFVIAKFLNMIKIE